MEFEIAFESEKNRFVIKTCGFYAVEDNISIIKQLELHPNWRKGLDVLVDHRQASFETARVDDIRHISEAMAVFEKKYGSRRCAIVAPSAGYSLVAFYKYDVDSKVDLVTKIFPSDEYDKALSWLDK